MKQSIQDIYFAIAYEKDSIEEVQKQHTSVLAQLKKESKMKPEDRKRLQMQSVTLDKEYKRRIQRVRIIQTRMEQLTDKLLIIDAPDVVSIYTKKGLISTPKQIVKRVKHLFRLPIDMTARTMIEQQNPKAVNQFMDMVNESKKEPKAKMEVKK